ncbi:MAG: hypothetical protein JWO63_894, partial [Frankiales bacterium]|nr:hypothetical protein [Frankiales bacterium]
AAGSTEPAALSGRSPRRRSTTVASTGASAAIGVASRKP